jgi:hypothetical protein
MLYPGNFEHDLVQMPFVTNPPKAATDLVAKLLAELARPLSDGFVADDDAAGRQQLLRHAQPEREAEIQPHGMADDLGREPIPGVAGASGWPHPTRLLTPICLRKRGKARQVDGAPSVPLRRSRFDSAPTEVPRLEQGSIERPGTSYGD